MEAAVKAEADSASPRSGPREALGFRSPFFLAVNRPILLTLLPWVVSGHLRSLITL